MWILKLGDKHLKHTPKHVKKLEIRPQSKNISHEMLDVIFHWITKSSKNTYWKKKQLSSWMKKENYINLTLTTLNKHQKFTSNIFFFSITNIFLFLIFQILVQGGFTNYTTNGK
jgi:hypothetical protein